MPEKYIKHLRDDEAIREKVRWAINYISDVHGMTNEKLAKFIGVSTSTINSYRRKVTLPGLEFFAILLYKYSFNLNWFMLGEGEPFPGAREKYPEVCGPPPIDAKPIIDGMKAALGKNEHPTALDAQQINVNEAMGMTYQVLTSGTPFAVALYLNIQQFSNAVNMSHEIRDLKEELRMLNGKVDILQKQVDRLTAAPVTATAQEDSSEKAAM